MKNGKEDEMNEAWRKKSGGRRNLESADKD